MVYLTLITVHIVFLYELSCARWLLQVEWLGTESMSEFQWHMYLASAGAAEKGSKPMVQHCIISLC